jgi:hypothetical protein
VKTILSTILLSLALATLTGCPPRLSHARLSDGRTVATAEAWP